VDQDRAWVDMRLHESHEEGGFGVSNNTITRHAASYTTNARFVAFLGTFARPAQQVWLPGNDIQDPTTWDAPRLCTLRRLHGDLLQQYDCTEQAAPQPPPPSAGCSAAANAGAHPQPPAGSQDNSNFADCLLYRVAVGGACCTNLPTATRPPSFGIQAEAGVPLSVLQLSRPAGPAAPEVRHPYPKACHGAAHQALGALQDPASSLRRHALRGAAPASHATETQSHGPGLHPARGDEQPRRASRPTTPRHASSSGSPSHGSAPSGPPPPTMPSTQHSGRRLSPRR
jgi:hypothetical protein